VDFVHGELGHDALAEFDGHLDTCPECREVISALSMASGDVVEAPQLGRGSELGRYLIVEVLGQGAMGVVYAAYDPELDRRVALKLLRADAEVAWSMDARERLVREAKAMAKLSHPNVVTIYEVGEAAGQVFLAMELVEGMSLRQWLDDGTERSWQQVRNAFVQAGRGLAAAHDAGLVHRDFKPDNVLVAHDGRVVVTDFGLARGTFEGALPTSAADDVGDAMGEAAEELTATGALVGTPAYMAPELFTGASADARSDQYGFCVALWEALYGARPFTATSLQQLGQRAASGRLPEVSRGKVPRWLHAAAVKGLQPDKAARHPDLHALVRTLDRTPARSGGLLLGGAALVAAVAAVIIASTGSAPPPVQAAPVCAEADTRVSAVWSRDKADKLRRAMGAGALVETTIAALDGWADAWASMHTATCRATRVEGRQSERLLDTRMACLQRQLQRTAALVDALGQARSYAGGRVVAALDGLPDVAACGDIEALAAVAPPTGNPQALERVSRAQSLLDAARVRVSLAPQDAKAALAAALKAVAVADYPPLTARARVVQSGFEREVGDLDGAVVAARDGLWTAQKARDDRTVALAWLALVEVEASAGQLERAAVTVRHADAAVARLGAQSLLRARLLLSQGIIDTRRERFGAARKALDASLALRRGAARTPALTALGNLARLEKRYADALEHHSGALQNDRKFLGGEHPNIGRHHHNLARIHRLQGRWEEAFDHYRRALQLKEKTLGKGHHEVALTLNSLGLLHYERGAPAKARPLLERARAIFAAAKHTDEALAAFNVGVLDASLGKVASARAHLESARAIWRQAYGKDHPRVARVRAELARLKPAAPAPAIEPTPKPRGKTSPRTKKKLAPKRSDRKTSRRATPEKTPRTRPPMTYGGGQTWDRP